LGAAPAGNAWPAVQVIVSIGGRHPLLTIDCTNNLAHKERFCKIEKGGGVLVGLWASLTVANREAAAGGESNKYDNAINPFPAEDGPHDAGGRWREPQKMEARPSPGRASP